VGRVERKKLRPQTESRMVSILSELQTFAQENNIALESALSIQLIDALRGISYRIYKIKPERGTL
jgi:hypothetical protein